MQVVPPGHYFGWSYITQRRGLLSCCCLAHSLICAHPWAGAHDSRWWLRLSTSYMLGVVQALGGVWCVLEVFSCAWGIPPAPGAHHAAINSLIGFALGVRVAVRIAHDCSGGSWLGWFLYSPDQRCIQVIWQTRTRGSAGTCVCDPLDDRTIHHPARAARRWSAGRPPFWTAAHTGRSTKAMSGKNHRSGSGRGAALLLVLTVSQPVLLAGSTSVRELRMLDQEELGRSATLVCASCSQQTSSVTSALS